MESHSLCLPGTAASIVSSKNKMVMPARQDGLEARNDKLSDAFAFLYAQSPLAILAFNHL